MIVCTHSILVLNTEMGDPIFIFDWNILRIQNRFMIVKDFLWSISLRHISWFWLLRSFGLDSPTDLDYLAFQYFDYKHSKWRPFQKCVLSIKLNMYISYYMYCTGPYLCWWTICSRCYYSPSSTSFDTVMVYYIFLFELNLQFIY